MGSRRHHRQIDGQQLAEIATHLSDAVVTEMDQLAVWVRRENEQRHAAAAERAERAERSALAAEPTPQPVVVVDSE